MPEQGRAIADDIIRFKKQTQQLHILSSHLEDKKSDPESDEPVAAADENIEADDAEEDQVQGEIGGEEGQHGVDGVLDLSLVQRVAAFASTFAVSLSVDR